MATRPTSSFTHNKEYYVVPGAVHIDLYDDMNIIPFDKIEEFFGKHLA